MFWLMFLVGLVIGIFALFAMSFANAAAMCADEFEEGEAARLREEDATPQ